MTTIVSTSDATYADSLHRVNVAREWAPDYYDRKIHITACGRLAYVISGNSYFSQMHRDMLDVQLQLIINQYKEQGFLNSDILTEHLKNLFGVTALGSETNILLIFKDCRYLINEGEVTLIPYQALVTMGTGSAVMRTLFDVHYDSDKFTPEQLLSYGVQTDGLSSGPWIRIKHDILKGVKDDKIDSSVP